MSLTDEEVTRLSEHVEDMQCPLCDHNDFSLYTATYGERESRGDQLEEESFLPVVKVVCEYCSHVLDFSADHLGLGRY